MARREARLSQPVPHVIGDARAPLGAPVRLFCPGDRASGCERGPPGPPIRPAFASLHPHRVQPL